MPVFSKFIDGVLFKGGILAAGVVCSCLAKLGVFPRYVEPVSYGMTTLGLLGMIVGCVDVEDDEEDEDPGHAERMAEFFRLRPRLLQILDEQRQLALEYELLRLRWEDIDALERDSARFGEIISEYEARMADGRVAERDPVAIGRRKHHSARDGEKRLLNIGLRFKMTRRCNSWDKKAAKDAEKFLNSLPSM